MRARALVIGSGPNGLAAAITLAQAGLDVEVHETAAVPGGGVRSFELTLPGFVHDFGAAVFPMAAASPFFSQLPLPAHGLQWIHSPTPLAHPLDDGTAVVIERSIEETSAHLGADAAMYRNLFSPFAARWSELVSDVLQPVFHRPHHPLLLGRFGVSALQPATVLARAAFKTERARALFAGLAAHSVTKLESPLSSAFALLFGAAAHAVGWPFPHSGAHRITETLIEILGKLGGRVITNSRISALQTAGSPDLTLCDVSPAGFLQIAGAALASGRFARSLARYKQGPGVFKMDWALREPIPWRAKECLRAATVHLGGTLAEIAESERAAVEGKPPAKPFVLLAQPSLFDPVRAPAGQQTVWAYCHVPHGWGASAKKQIENQIERFAPGFRDCVLASSCSAPADLEAADENLVGGDVIGGATTIRQILFRPTWRQYATPLSGVYLCSGATPPGGGVHGMCGYNAAQSALRWLRRRRHLGPA